jgi:hypothetical protein
MIKVTELRVGNLILPRTGTDEHVKVTDIDEYGSIGTEAYFWDGAGSTGTTSEIARGIPLTPEWLERCGIAYSKTFKCYSKDYELLFCNEGDQFWLCEQDAIKGGLQKIGKSFQYLHQLQNLYFALTGEELHIKMP